MISRISFVMAFCALWTAAIAPASAEVWYNYAGADGNWTTIASWGTSSSSPNTTTAVYPPVTGGGTTTVYANKIYVNANLTYSSAQGYTVFNPSSFSMVVGAGGSATLTLTGGTWDSSRSQGDVVGHSNNGALTINGGTYVNLAGALSPGLLALGWVSAGKTGTFTVTSGSAAVSTIQFGQSNTTYGIGIVNLDGGVLSAGNFSDVATGSTANSYVYFNGGMLKALQNSTSFMTGLDHVYVKSGGAIIDTNSYNITIGNGLLASSASTGGGLTKNGSGVLTLSGANTYTGATTVNVGTLALASTGSLVSTALSLGGSSAAEAVFDVSAKSADYTLATLSGVGTIALASGKTLTLSNAINHTGIDNLAISGGLTLASGVANTYEIDLAANAQDYTNVSGSLNYNGTSLTIAFSGEKTTGVYTFDILDFGGVLGTAASVDFTGLTTGESAVYDASTGVVTLTVVPEPGALSLLAGALFGLIAYAWRKRWK